MNQKKAKQLRKQAEQVAAQDNLEPLLYTHKSYRKFTTDITGKVIQYVVYTLSMEDCERKVYKASKKEFKLNKA